MLYIIFWRDKQNISEEQASKMFGKRILLYPDSEFDYLVVEEGIDPTSDKIFKEIVREVDKSEVLCKNVLKDIYTGDTHNVREVSTGVKTLYLAAIGHNVMFLSQWFGPNCYQLLFDISKNVDVYLYDDSDMFCQDNYRDISGYFMDVIGGDVIHWNGSESWRMMVKRGRV